MKFCAIKSKKLSVIRVISQKAKNDPQMRIVAVTLLILALMVLSLGTVQGTLGKYSKSFPLTDLALISKFDVEITAPEEFVPAQGGEFLELQFPSSTDTKAFSFQVSNNGEVAVVCTPHINNGVEYHILVSGAACTEFVVNAQKTVNFLLVVGAGGLGGNIKEAKFSIDIKQLEGV